MSYIGIKKFFKQIMNEWLNRKWLIAKQSLSFAQQASLPPLIIMQNKFLVKEHIVEISLIRRYVNHTLIFTKSESSAIAIVEKFNKIAFPIKFILNKPNDKNSKLTIPFLDHQIAAESGKISGFNIYRKPLSTHKFMPAQSYVSTNAKRNIIYNERTWIQNNCMDSVCDCLAISHFLFNHSLSV